MKFRTKYEGPCVDYPGAVFAMPPQARFQRPEVKTDKCCHCGTCYLFCPTGCINDQGTYFAPNILYCKGCGICVKECPVHAITLVREEVE